MSFSSNFLNLIIDSNCDLYVKSKYLEEGRHFSYFSSLDQKQVESIKQKINSLLSLHNKRLEGLVLLNQYLDECQHLLILNESISWATFCLQSSTNKNAFEKQLAFVCLNKIFNAASNSPEIYRMLSGTIVTQFIELLPQMKIENADHKTVQEFANCFEICLKTFKGPCSSRRKIIEDFILNVSSSSNFILLAKSFALLAFTGSNKQLQTNNYFNHFAIICVYSLDTLLDTNLDESYQLPYYCYIKEKPFLTLDNNTNRMEKKLDFLNKFKFLCSVIQHLLDENFDGQVKIPITLILNFIQRIVSLKVDRKSTTANLENILNSNIVPSMYSHTLLVLNQLITTCSTNLSTNLKEINKILLDLLDNFSNDKSFLIEIKSLWYKVVCNFFNKLGGHLIVLVSKQWGDLIIQNFIEDIRLKKDKLELGNSKQQKTERSLNTKFSENSYFSNHELMLCLSACQTMQSFLVNFSRIVNAKKLYKFIYELLIIIQDLYRIDLYRKSTYFIDPKLRLNLLKVFRNCLISFTSTSLLNNAISVLNTVLKLDKSSDIQLFAKETLIIVNFPKSKVYYSVHDNSSQEFEKEFNSQLNTEETIDYGPVLGFKDSNEKNSSIQLSGSENNVKEASPVQPFENSNSNEENKTLLNQKSSNDELEGKLSEPISEVSTNKKIINIESNENVSNDDKILNDKTPSAKRTRTRTKSFSEEIQPLTTRLTRSSIKKKLEEENNEQNTKKVKTQNELVNQKTIVEEDSEGEVEDILKDFVDV